MENSEVKSQLIHKNFKSTNRTNDLICGSVLFLSNYATYQ